MDVAAEDDARQRVLVVDDHEMICEFVVQVLDPNYYAVQAVDNGRDALELLRGWGADLILLDLALPIMDGRAFRLAQLADARLAAIPVVIMSGFPVSDIQALSLGAAAILLKPFRPDLLVETVRQLIGPITGLVTPAQVFRTSENGSGTSLAETLRPAVST